DNKESAHFWHFHKVFSIFTSSDVSTPPDGYGRICNYLVIGYRFRPTLVNNLRFQPQFAANVFLRNALKKYFGYDKFSPLQEQIVTDALAGHDVLALMPT